MSGGPTDDRYQRYLLGELPEQERDAVEEEYFSSDAAFEDLRAAEDDLLDAYTEGALSDEDRPRFQTRHLDSQDGLRRVAFVRALKRAGREHLAAAGRSWPAPTRPSWRGWAAGLTGAALAAGLVFSLFQATRERGQAREEREALQRRADEQVQRIEEQGRGLAALREEVDRLRTRAQELEGLIAHAGRAGRVVSLLLKAGFKRGLEPAPHLSLPPDVAQVRLTLPLAGDLSGLYRVSLLTPEGREVWARSGLRTERVEGGVAIVTTVPAAVLSTGHYVVAVSRAGPSGDLVAEYVFRASRP